jgi:glycosyltransferase involved in cell wall biosynthesis
MPKVSVIIPSYNRALLLARAIESVLTQTFRDLELIVVDDHSPEPEVRAVIEEYERQDARVRPIFLDRNSGGPAHPKNVGFPLAKGEYVAYLDSDDEWLPHKLERQLALAKLVEGPSLGVISCNAYLIDDWGVAKGLPMVAKPGWGNVPWAARVGETAVFRELHYDTLRDVLRDPFRYASSNSGMLFPRRAVEAIGSRDEEVKEFEDTDIVLRVAEAGLKFYLVDEPLIKVHKHGENFTRAYDRLEPAQAARRADEFALFLKKHPVFSGFPRLLGEKWRGIGMLYLLGGDRTRAREYFARAIRANPFALKNYFHALFLFLGSSWYRLLFRMKGACSLLK